jgi:myo-inositol 2-dehydrogenase / D-chiro-inositol 1-dehydrogenase
VSVRVALFGAGRIGTIHAEDIAAHPGSDLVAVVDEIPQAAERLAARFGARVALAEAALESLRSGRRAEVSAFDVEAPRAASEREP